ncbi:unnamed protein product [Didymodactylos carnosus]|uniref:ISXO2-like transposase domain-containing protein n=1 Tax=Didymodactylos carnosus TaxID=1234261 RepID=A0A814X429_9BILA|nr:unnamed protein product [Didymodactylos carnosus]CAF1211030.1 unnamed protein product [Didymodactylos carnosus]CAF3634870.1 unnamed protein product [Didymodactylos carnosus]CAF3975014.1 unnamed protein product [Didymodactylos carnosus]
MELYEKCSLCEDPECANVLNSLGRVSFAKGDNDEAIDHCSKSMKLFKMGLIPYCPSQPCSNGHHNWYMSKYSRAQDKYQWRCRSKGCKLTRSIRDGTFFSNSKLTIQQILDLIYYWSQGEDTHEHLRRHCNFSSTRPKLVVSNMWWKSTKARGRNGNTIVGGWHKTSGDQWRAYSSLNTNVNQYEHYTVNHTLNFVDPETAVHTQNVENMWMCAKRKKKSMMGMPVTLLQTYLTEFMWRQKFGGQPFENLVKQIKELYPTEVYCY